MNQVVSLLRAAIESLRRPANYPDSTTPKGRNSHDSTKATQKGATHVQGRVFLSIPGDVTPAEYRRQHRGRKKNNGSQ